MHLCITYLIYTKYHSKCYVYSNEEETNSQFSSFLDPTSHIFKQNMYLYFYLLITEHPTPTDLNRREMNLLPRLEVQKYHRCLPDTSGGFSLSCLFFLSSFVHDYSNSGPPVSDRKVQRERQNVVSGIFPEDVKELSQTIAFHISM